MSPEEAQVISLNAMLDVVYADIDSMVQDRFQRQTQQFEDESGPRQDCERAFWKTYYEDED